MKRSKEGSVVLPPAGLDHLERLMAIIAAAEGIQQRQPEEEVHDADSAQPEVLPVTLLQSEPAEASGCRVEATAQEAFADEKQTSEKDGVEKKSKALEREEEQARNVSVGNSSISTAKKLAGEVQAWCAGPRQRADEQIAELKELRSGLASTAWGFFRLAGEQAGGEVSPWLHLEGTTCTEDVSKRIEALVEELIKHEKAGQPPATSTGKRKLSEAFVGRAQPQPGPEHDFLKKKKAFLRGLHESFKRVRQRETVCMSLDKRLLSARLLLEQARRGCQGSDYVSICMRSKRQVEQAYKELLQVQQDMDRIRSSSSPPGSPPAAPELKQQTTWVQCSLRSAAEEEVEAELSRQVETNMQLKQRAERAESLLAAERVEVDRLRGQLQGVSGRLRQEARSLGECMRARQATVDKLRCQVQQLEERDARLSSRLEAALRHKEEVSAEKEELAWRLCGQNSELDKVRRENVSLVVEKLAMEGSSRSLQHKVDGLMAKLGETKQWSRSMMSTCKLGLL